MCLAWPSGLWRSPVVQCARGAPGRRSLYYLRGVRPLLADRGSDRGLPALATESAAPRLTARRSQESAARPAARDATLNCASPTGRDRKSTRLELQSRFDLVCRLLLEKKKIDGNFHELSKKVISNDQTRLVDFDLTADDEAVWGWGLGCNGAM